MSDQPKVKTYCYKSECNIVITGFQHEQYSVCTICKEEVDSTLSEKIKDRKNSVKNSSPQYDDSYIHELDLWSVCNGLDIFGDGQ